ncbi:pyrroline-5-carboxylate reductase [Halalkalibacterium halodurans]|uniref:pyrroline-5-carboxylate reductase n=1 Tax=Halalkalibacterium halodurans TaxID=86665 RepID=UPI002AA98488|nr:pyrroline-5-carboxylate reductase [Halalkalibacterium halodurans]MDY7221385.1 pyrroline-5-carboxylate reductase [Halalkalibacterium halodurans]MDY7240624.1 pyrroline-5-carboxylate reductase [Halalkalibacterium halodurans]MED4080750.1 pyrroline-5-carboxylate reductase [Halalkalibacterium halodurans]MED4086207.1 pyrroline-5-carboxylate reductase [Halalkalibacterium halodurans]MED4106889.1 pyrroline-5-carboxylate reductase [Halalkalibacterium halodurans]
MKQHHMLIIGAGRMAEAIFSGILKREENPFHITVSNDKDVTRLEELKKTYPVKTTTDWTAMAEKADVILLACPPAAHENVLKKLSPSCNGQLVITVAAGIGPTDLETHLPKGTPTAWIMPNTAASVGESMSIYCFGQHVKERDKQLISFILDAIGMSEQLTESQIHHLTAITGSAPAFLYFLAEALEQSAQSYGVAPEKARELVIGMITGSAKMLEEYKDPTQLREQVTTPGGATAAGLQSLLHDDFQGALQRAVQATNGRAQERAN